MKAIRVHQFGGPENLRLEDVPEPKPGRGEVVVRIHAAGVNPVDTYIRLGQYAVKPSLPYTPGADGGGVVESVGEGVTRFKVGDRVYTSASISGTYAELALCPEDRVHPLPKAATFAQGAALGVPYGTAYRAMFQKAKVEPGETVLVHGASGGVGVACVQLGRAAGVTIIGTAGTDKGLALVREHGAAHVFDHGKAGYLDEIMKLTGGRGVDAIMEMLANKNLASDLSLLGKKGRVMVIGNRGTIEINPRDTMVRDASIIGMTMFNVGPEELRSIHAALVAGLASGMLKPVIGKEMPLADGAKAHEAVMAPGAYGKIVLVP